MQHGSVVIAAITSCTNTSNPSVMMAAGLLAKKAVGDAAWQSQAVGEDQPGARLEGRDRLPDEAGLMRLAGAAALPPRRLRLHDLHRQQRPAAAGRCRRQIDDDSLVVAAVLSGNRNFEGRVHPEVRANYLASPPLVVAYALAGRVDIDLRHRAARHTAPTASRSILKDIWPTQKEVQEAIDRGASTPEMFRKEYGEVFEGDEHWRSAAGAGGRPVRLGRQTRPTSSTRRTSRTWPTQPAPVARHHGRPRAGRARRQHHDRPHFAGRLDQDRRARPGKYLIEHGVAAGGLQLATARGAATTK